MLSIQWIVSMTALLSSQLVVYTTQRAYNFLKYLKKNSLKRDTNCVMSFGKQRKKYPLHQDSPA